MALFIKIFLVFGLAGVVFPETTHKTIVLFPPTTLAWAKTIHFVLDSPGGLAKFDQENKKHYQLAYMRWLRQGFSDLSWEDQHTMGIFEDFDPLVDFLRRHPAVSGFVSTLDEIDSLADGPEKENKLSSLLSGLDETAMGTLIATLEAAEEAAPALVLEKAREEHARIKRIEDTSEILKAGLRLQGQLREYCATWGNEDSRLELEKVSELVREKQERFLRETAAQSGFLPADPSPSVFLDEFRSAVQKITSSFPGSERNKAVYNYFTLNAARLSWPQVDRLLLLLSADGEWLPSAGSVNSLIDQGLQYRREQRLNPSFDHLYSLEAVQKRMIEEYFRLKVSELDVAAILAIAVTQRLYFDANRFIEEYALVNKHRLSSDQIQELISALRSPPETWPEDQILSLPPKSLGYIYMPNRVRNRILAAPDRLQ